MKVKVAQLCLTLCAPIDYTVHGILQVEILEWIPPPGDLPNPGIEPRSPALQVDSLPAEPQEKPKNTGLGSLSLLQWIFQTQESNWGLLHCRWILYQLSYQGSPSCSVVSDSLQPHALYSPWSSPDQNTGVGSLSLLQGIFPTQGSNPGLLHCRQILYQLSYKGSPETVWLTKMSGSIPVQSAK